MRAGSRLGPYEIVAPLGAGGMGEVYRARDTRLGREVAIKVLPGEFAADPDRLRRFEQEARAASALNHPNIVVVFDVGSAPLALRARGEEPRGAARVIDRAPGAPGSFVGLRPPQDDGAVGSSLGGAGSADQPAPPAGEPVHYLVTELLEGETLRERLRNGALPARKAMELAGQVASGLAAAHEKGIVHRDLKPENLFITRDGHVKILDFGVAKLKPIQPEPAAAPTVVDTTAPGMVIGTVAYMSPEQVRGQMVDHRSDIFSFGAVLYEMVTGTQAFTRDTGAETMTAILKEEPREPSNITPTTPVALSRAIVHCLEKHPEERFQSARDLAFDLKAIATDTGGTRAGPALAHPARRRRLVWLPLGGAAVLAVAVGAFFYLRGRPPRTDLTLEPKRIVVAVFENQTGDRTLDAFGRMASDWIGQGLSQIPSVEVVPTSATMRAEQAAAREAGAGSRADPLRALALETGAGTVVSGSYYLLGQQLQLQAKVTDAVHGTLIYAVEPVSGAREAPMLALDSLRQRVMGVAAVHFWSDSPGQVRRPPEIPPQLRRPPLFESYREYIAGLELFGEDYAQAIRHFEKAAEIDPDFVSPQLYIATSYGNQGDYERANAIVQRVSQSRERLTPFERHLLDWYRASLAGHDAEALQAIREAEKLVPKSTLIGYLVGLECLNLNLPQQTVDTFTRLTPEGFFDSHSIPGSWRFNVLAQAHHMLAGYERELEVADQAIRAFPDLLSVRGGKVRALAALGRLDELARVIDESLAVQSRAGTPSDLMLQAAAELRAHGHREAALQMAARAVGWLEARPVGEKVKETYRPDLAGALCGAERWDEARAIYRELAERNPVARRAAGPAKPGVERKDVSKTVLVSQAIDYLGALGTLAARRGERAEAERISDELARIEQPFIFGWHTYWRACIAALLGEKQRAVDLLRESFAQGNSYDVVLHRDMDLEPLWDYPPFVELIRPKG